MKSAKSAFILRFPVKLAMTAVVITACSIGLSAPSDAKSLWNPVDWFTPSPERTAELTAKEAQHKAEAAQEKADAASKAAEEARLAAEKAQQAAAQLSEKAQSSTTNATSTESPKLQQAAVKQPEPETTASKEPPQTADSKTDTKSGGWHMLNIFDKPETVKAEEGRPEAPSVSTTTSSDHVAAAESSDTISKSTVALLETEKGNIAFELYPEESPKTVANFVKLANEGFYNKYNMKFHRVVPGFVIQTGDPTGTGAGGSKQTVPLESKSKRLSHNAKGVVAMARGFDPNSATSQFYITLAPQTALDGKYAIFGKVISGMNVLDKIEVGDMLYGVRMVDVNTINRDPVEKKGFFKF